MGIPQNLSKFLFVGCLILAGYLAFSFAGGWLQSQRLSDERANAREEVEQLKEEKARLESVRAYVSSDLYIEQEARRQLGYITPGAIPFVIQSPPPAQPDAPGEWWQRLFPR